MSTLLRQVSEELALVDSFLHLLEEEARVLTEGRYETLPVLTRAKDRAAARLAAAGAEREQLLVSLGFSADRAGGDAAAAGGSAALQQAWERLMTQAARAREQNHRNGVKVHAQLDFTRQSIAFLQSGSRPLYGPDGQHSAGRGQRLRLSAG